MRRKPYPILPLAALQQAADAEDAQGLPRGLQVSRSRRGPILQWHSTRDFVRTRAVLPLVGLPPGLEGLRLLHLSDLHMHAAWCEGYDRLIALVQENPPDLILFTGDFIEDRYDHRPALPTVLRLFGQLPARHGIYAIFGNHDPDVMMPCLIASGIRFITHARVVVPLPAGLVELIGFPGPSRFELDMDFVESLPTRIAGMPRIILSHYPDLLGAAMPLDPDLYLSGHTHGGQICLPNGWPPITHDRMPRRFCKGIHRIGRTWYAVSNGLGFTGVSLRAFCPAEATEFMLRA